MYFNEIGHFEDCWDIHLINFYFDRDLKKFLQPGLEAQKVEKH